MCLNHMAYHSKKLLLINNIRGDIYEKKLLLWVLSQLIGWYLIQLLFKNIPIDSTDLNINYYLTKIILESMYIIFIINNILTLIIKWMKIDKE